MENGHQNDELLQKNTDNSFSNKSLIKNVMQEVNCELDEKTVKEFLSESKFLLN